MTECFGLRRASSGFWSRCHVTECDFFPQTGQQQVLSQQMLIDCSWGFGNNGCDGGEEWRGYEWIMKHGGIATTETYGAYMGMVSLRREGLANPFFR